MKILKKGAAVLLSAVICATALSPLNVFAEEDTDSMDNTKNFGTTRDVVIDGSTANTKENMLYRGAGMVSANNSSRLLLDYKAENPDAYWEIMNYMFGSDGIEINHLKVEMGADINSSSGTEPSVKRTEDEKADVTRGAAYQLAADAKTINPDLTLDMLWWSEPKWISNAEDEYAARYKWYKETLDAAYETYGIKFDYVSAVQNERGADYEWIKYLSKNLKSEKDCPYDYSKIKIVGGEGVCSWGFADEMLYDEELMNAVDVVGSHYTSKSTEEAQKLANEYGKELWFSEACPPMSYSKGTYKYDATGSGLNDINGLLDIANRVITMYPQGKMNLYEYQPVVAAYYDGACYCQKQLITANDPWNGYYYLGNGFYMSLHFSQFVKKGWAFVDSASYADGVAGGDGHAIVDANYSYFTAADTSTGDYSTVLTNTTPNDITYNFTVSNLDKASSAVNVWETRGPDDGAFDENYFKHIDTVTPAENDGIYTYSVTIKPYSLVTLSTVEVEQKEYTSPAEEDNTVLSLPYSDDYEYAGYPDDYLSSRGGAPRYTTDEGGAFEVVNKDGNNVLMQKITPDIKAGEWGSTPNPTTNFGDDRWFNYSAQVDVSFEPSDKKEENYTGIGVRYTLPCAGESGYWFQLFEDGTWNLKRNKDVLINGKLENFDAAKSHTIKIEAFNTAVCTYVDGEKACDYVSSEESVLSAGRCALFSSYDNNCFDNLKVEAVDGYDTYVTRFDNTDDCFEYAGEWEHNTMCGFANLKRTLSTGKEGSSFTLNFNGTGFAISGATAKDAIISVEVDGKVVEDAYVVKGTGSRELSYNLMGLEDKAHTAKITVKSGEYAIDGMQASVVTKADETSAEKTETTKKKSAALPIAIGVGAAAVIGATAGIILRRHRTKHA